MRISKNEQKLFGVRAEKTMKKTARSTRVEWVLFITSVYITDALLLAAGFLFAYILRFDFNLSIFNEAGKSGIDYYQAISVVLLPVWLAIYTFRGLYKRNNLLGGTHEYSLVFNAAILGTFAGILLEFFIGIPIARGWVLLSFGLNFLFTAFGRFTLRRIVYRLRKYGYFLQPTLIVGANAEGLLITDQLSHAISSGLNVVGFVDNKYKAGELVSPGLYCLGKADQLDTIIEQYGIKELILAGSAFSARDHMLNIFKSYGINHDVTVRFSSGLYEIIATGLNVKEIGYVPLLEINPVKLTGLDWILKTLLDYTVGILTLIFASPLYLLIALLVKLDSPGPVIHRRRVVGMGGKEFDAFKFRTMREDGDEILAQYPEKLKELKENHKIIDDPRITKIGKFLRKLSLDELPQLINVFKREMSLVGPRMITLEETSKYKQFDINLLTVPPGITGLWQVNGRSDLSYDARVQLDMYYIRNWNIWLDLKLILQTIPVVITARGAY